MIELRQDQLVFSFPDVPPQAKLAIDFQRTLRIPDDDKTYPLPPGLGRFPLRHVDDFAETVPASWVEHGGVMFPMFQSEVLWLHFHADYVMQQGAYPFAIKVGTGKIDAVTGKDWSQGLHRGLQDYMVAPRQPWLDGYCVEKGVIRQFVAMPLGAGYSAEEQITGKAEHGGLQIIAYPMKSEVFERRFPKMRRIGEHGADHAVPPELRRSFGMGLAPGGRMKQKIFKDPFDLSDWDLDHSSRCFVHLANSLHWRAITGEAPPTMPPTAKQYAKAKLPWFDYYDEASKPLPGAGVLSKLKSVLGMGKAKGEQPLPENETCEPKKTVKLRPRGKDEVREGVF